MKYIFYDIESSNGNQFEPSICSFGYIITNEKFEILEENDIPINPPTDFTNHVLNDVGLAYSVEEFKKSKNFSEEFTFIKSKFEEANYAFGFDIIHDIHFFNSTCDYYKLRRMNFEYYDIQKIVMACKRMNFKPGLRNLARKFDIEINDELHKSSEDAKVSLYVLKALLESRNENLKTLLKKINLFPEYEMDYLAHTKIHAKDEMDRLKEKHRVMRKNLEQKYINYLNEIPKDSVFKTIYLSDQVLDMLNIDNLNKFIKILIEKKYRFHQELDGRAIYLKISDESDEIAERYCLIGGKTINLSQLIS